MKKLKCLLATLAFLAVAIHGVQGGAMVTGTVFCDQCKDGQVSLFDYPLSGMKVTMVCPGNAGQMSLVGEETTNMLGNYVMSFDGTPDLSSCYTQISPNSNGPGSSGCGASAGPPKSVRLMFNMFDMEMYSVDPLISQPAQPMSFCSKSTSPPSSPNPVAQPPPTSSSPPSTPSPVTLPPPVIPVTPVAPPSTPKAPTPAFKLPPLPHMPPLPFLEVSACSHEYWLKPEYKCYWRAVSPDLPVAMVFGPLAARKYGTGVTLWTGLQGKGDPYRTLLREAVTSLLNSYNSFYFPYNAFQVLHDFNSALTGSTRSILLTALRFKRANSGHGQASCKFTPCK